MPKVDISNNFNRQSVGATGEFGAKIPQEESPLKFSGEDDWCSRAADAINEAFTNMDDFLLNFKESQNISSLS